MMWSVSTTIKELPSAKQGVTYSNETMLQVIPAVKQICCFLTPITAKRGTAITIVAVHHSSWDSARTAETHQGLQPYLLRKCGIKVVLQQEIH